MTGDVLPDLVRRAARERGERIAVVDRDLSITYGDLDRRSDALAGRLVSSGVEPGDRVGLYLEKSIESVVGIYGVLKAGAAYVPLDEQSPEARCASIASDCGLRVLLTDRKRAEAAGRLCAQPIALDDTAAYEGSAPETVHPAADDLAYILYTSGSTGMPKGVMLTHRNALAFVNWGVETFGIGPDDTLSSHAPLHFDLSILDLYAAAAVGAPVVLVSRRASMFPVQLKQLIDAQSITIWYSVPSILTMLTLRGGLQHGDLPSLRRILFAGEVFPTRHLRELMSLLPHVSFSNLYGPTETNVCTWFDVPADGPVEPLPIGRALPGVEVLAVSEDGDVVPAGEPGELCVSGPTVMKGYWGAPELTALRLVPHPRGEGLVYRTGDLGVDDGAGVWTLIGRRDDQIKSRGYRIELGEVETALYGHPGVVECAVVAIPDDMVTNTLQAHVVARGDVDAGALARFCAERIPKYMVPDDFVFHKRLPKTSTGKIDKRGLIAT